MKTEVAWTKMNFEQQMKDTQSYIHFLTLWLERCWGTSELHHAHILQGKSRDDKCCMHENPVEQNGSELWTREK